MRWSPNRNVELLEQVGQGTNMVLVSVRDDNPADALAMFEEIVEARSSNVDAQAVAWKGHTTVDEDDSLAALERQAVHADLAQASKRDQLQVCGVHFWRA
jgi:hypothetical protein